MRDPKLWTDLLTAAWLVWSGLLMETNNARSYFIFKFVPLVMAFLLAMSHAKALF